MGWIVNQNRVSVFLPNFPALGGDASNSLSINELHDILGCKTLQSCDFKSKTRFLSIFLQFENFIFGDVYHKEKRLFLTKERKAESGIYGRT
ncbi:MAG: hypothetical protein MJY47_01755 [Fibrobacter sp.]|nr:hypothetical protein [Fibrobacter sp.]